MEILSAIFSLIGVAIGGAIGYFSNIHSEERRIKREERSIAYALKAEMSSLRLVIEKRQYVKEFTDAYNSMGYTSEPIHIDIRVENDYFQVYKANLNKIGHLKPIISDKVCQFYTLAYAIIEDLKKLQLMRNEYAAVYMELYIEIIEFLNLALSLAAEAEAEIENEYH